MELSVIAGDHYSNIVHNFLVLWRLLDTDWFCRLVLCVHREQKDPQYLRDKLTQKHSKEQFDAAQKVEQEFGRFFTGRFHQKKKALLIILKLKNLEL